ncbi:acetyltransferase (GNAT) family protein [Kineococcus xinjiangensis]|uniref:Acetyltransferase (GNAT) family protein n=1 Tax=Kineococcus xinjiangensis TaxID=512762 RepID=A0A2S6ID18_9ACTN|nr:GNAT family N-acetyltransferase [Kineococcus xinjiangensis]PPK92099.1 acetyltransferase (GNAT) family protein [Kineococcus xinjiangensis]
MTASTTSTPVVHLGGGLELRAGRPADLEQVGALLEARGEPGDATDHRLVVEDPAAGWGSCAVVTDGDRVICTGLLLDETVRVADVHLPAGQIELVATAESHEGRGLVRSLMGWLHERSAERGHLLQVMIGIPYFYRLFGYEYAVDVPRAREFREPPPAAAEPLLRRAGERDVPALASLQESAQAGFDVAVPHSAPRRRWLLAHDTSTTWVLERDGAVVASARTGDPDDGVLVAEPAALDRAAAEDLLRALAAQFPGEALTAVHRPGTATGTAWEHLLAAPDDLAEQYYARIADPAPVLDALRPVLHRRLVAAGLDRTGDVLLSTFRASYRMAVEPGGLGPVRAGGRLQSPGAAGGAGVAPDQLPALLLGPLGMHGLARRRPDVYPGPDAELFDALFPPLSADLLTYYLPW